MMLLLFFCSSDLSPFLFFSINFPSISYLCNILDGAFAVVDVINRFTTSNAHLDAENKTKTHTYTHTDTEKNIYKTCTYIIELIFILQMNLMGWLLLFTNRNL